MGSVIARRATIDDFKSWQALPAIQYMYFIHTQTCTLVSLSCSFFRSRITRFLYVCVCVHRNACITGVEFISIEAKPSVRSRKFSGYGLCSWAYAIQTSKRVKPSVCVCCLREEDWHVQPTHTWTIAFVETGCTGFIIVSKARKQINTQPFYSKASFYHLANLKFRFVCNLRLYLEVCDNLSFSMILYVHRCHF